jgi:hypothetical protein
MAKKKNSRKNGKKKGPGNNRPKQPEPEIDHGRRRFLWWGLGGLATVAVAAAVGVPVYLSTRDEPQEPRVPSPEPTTQPDISDKFLNSDHLNETILRTSFDDLTDADNRTIDFMRQTMIEYHKKIDQLIKDRVIFTAEQGSEFCKLNFLNQFSDFIWKNNEELRNLITPFLKRNPNDASKIDLDPDVFLDLVREYFMKKGRYCAHHEFRHKSGSHFFTYAMAELDKTVHLNGSLWGNDVKEILAIYFKHPYIVTPYDHQPEKNDGSYNSATHQQGRLMIIPRIQEKVIRLYANMKIIPKNENEKLIQRLFTLGLEDARINSRKFREVVEQKAKSDRFHEITHVLFRKLHPNYSSLIPVQRNRDEMASTLTEMKNATGNFVYILLARNMMLQLAKNQFYKQATEEIFSYFEDDMIKHRYQQINYMAFDTQRNRKSIRYQIDRLPVATIRKIAARCFRDKFPEMLKTG